MIIQVDTDNIEQILSETIEHIDHDIWKGYFLEDEGEWEEERISSLSDLKEAFLNSLLKAQSASSE